ncbi:glycosyltransferase [Bilophila wadsworthia]|mgnify:CR=1 FL=1|uniref:glycosyltransferase n=1 Tax=Bilophila wadsworthia TaxID=35833 RepID=UPI0001F06E02|nr:glycosyltransferase [Bilophila wadsworthia]
MSPVTVLFNTYPVAFDCPGGGEIQLLQYEEHLAEQNIRVLRYDPWHPQFDYVDIIHYFSVQPGAWRFCWHVTEMRKMPLVISPIVWIREHKEHYPLWEIRSLMDMATAVLPNSRAECDQLIELFEVNPEKCTPIVNGVDDIFFKTVSASLFRETFSLTEPFILCMGNIESRKNQLRLIQAVKGLGLHLVLAGQDREADYAEHCRAVADETVHFVGRLEHKSELQRSAYAAASVLALPSSLETPGLVALEAGATGCRLALTSEGCTKEYFGDFACYLDYHKVDSIRTAIEKALTLPRSEQLSAFVKEKYTWHRAAQQLADVYHGILEHEGEVS